MDGTIPRAKLPLVLTRMRELSERYRLRVANVFMPVTAICIRSSSTTPTQGDELERAEAFGADILRLCVEVGGVLTGEHGVRGRETRPDAGDVQRD